MIIALIGPKHSGKDTVFGMLYFFSHLPCRRFAFADELKQEVSNALNIEIIKIEREKYFFRPLLQWWGDYRRKQNENYWISKTIPKIITYLNRDSARNVAIITDTRFLNEANELRSYKAILVRIERDLPRADNHISETECDSIEVDYVIKNNGTKEELENECKIFARKYGLALR